MRIKTFLETAGNFDERELLTRFHSGIARHLNNNEEFSAFSGTGAYLDINPEYSACDVAVMMGSWKNRDSSHHVVRQSVVKSAPVFIVVETPLLGRVMFQKNKQFRIGVNGFLNNSGMFFLDNCPGDRLEKLGIKWEGWKHKKDGDIILMLQLPGDASLRGINLYDWARDAIEKIRKHSNRKIIIRTHPGHGIKDTDEFYKFATHLYMQNINVSVSNGKETPLENDMSNAYCTVTYSSGSGIDSILSGIPTIATDPGNFAWDVSSRYLSHIENVVKADDKTIKQWLANLAYSQWSIDEMESGIVWKHLEPIIMKLYSTNLIQRKKSK